ncbi:MAG: protein TonB [Oleiphilaceae bacterium]
MDQTIETGVSATDRLGFTIFVAIAVHVLLVLTDFLEEDPVPSPFTMEITLSRFDDDKAPEKADFLAETNQLGSGQQEEKAKPASPLPIPSPPAKEQIIVAPSPSQAAPKTEQNKLITSIKSDAKIYLVKQTEDDLPDELIKSNRSLLEQSLEIAALQADFDQQLETYARRPRVTRLIAASTMKAEDSQYVSHVVRKIERTGSLNFPQEAGRELYGKPRISIAIYSDGSIKDVKVLQSSGNLVLDSETINIVHRAGPFAPFPKNVRKERDVLELIRTFSYNKSGVSSY